MPRNGSGVYSLPAGNPVVTGTVISSTWANNTLNDIAAALTQSLTRDGQTPVTGTINMGGNLIINLGDAITLQGALTLNQHINDYGHWCGTAGGTANALTLTPPVSIIAYTAGMYFTFKALASNTDVTTVSVSGLATKSIQNLGAALSAGDITVNQYYRITYDGTAFQIEGLFLFGSGAGFLPLTGGTMTGNIVMNGAVDLWDRGSNIASATTTDLSAATGNIVFITGDTEIEEFGTVSAGTVMFLKFASASAPNLVNSAALVLPGGQDIQTAQEDWMIAISVGAGNWVVPSFLRASGVPVVESSATASTLSSVRGLLGENGADADNDYVLDLQAAVLYNPDTETSLVYNTPVNCTVAIDTAGPALNGRDQAGAFSADTWLYFYIIYGAGQTVGGIVSETPPEDGGPTLPANYTHWAYCSAVYLDSSGDLIVTYTIASWEYYDVVVTTGGPGDVISSGTETTPTAVDASAFIPPHSTRFGVLLGLNADNKVARFYSGNQIGVATAINSGTNTSNLGTEFFPNVDQQLMYDVTSGGTVNGFLNQFQVPNGDA